MSSPNTEFKQSLLADVFVHDGEEDGGTPVIDMQKITMLIWEYRDSQEMVTFISQFLQR